MSIPTTFNRMGLAFTPTPPPPPIDENDYLNFTAKQANSKVRLTKEGTPPEINLEYSTDKKTWNTYNIDDVITLQNVNDKVYFRGDNDTFSSGYAEDYYNFALSGAINADGNVMSLLNKSCEQLTIPSSFCFAGLFRGNSILSSAPQLPATGLADWCYWEMFRGCNRIQTPPELPALTMKRSCYEGMFSHCYLSAFPELPATTLDYYCYSRMFENNNNVRVTPHLPANNLAYGCYHQMFRDCLYLSGITDLSATNLERYCYHEMFNNCQALRTVPEELPATTLSAHCYDGMFIGCNRLKVAPKLPAKTLVDNAYAYMLQRCSQLSSIEVNFEEWSNATWAWVYNVGANGIFKCPKALSAEYGIHRIPSGWTVVRNDYFYVEALSPSSSVGIIYSGSLPVINEGEGEWVYPEPEWVYPDPEWDPDANDGEGDWVQPDPYEQQGDPEWVPAEPEYGVGINMEYSTDLINWSTLDIMNMQEIPLSNVGDRVYFRGDNITFTTASVENIYDTGDPEFIDPEQHPDSAIYYFTGQGYWKIGGKFLSICDSSSMSDSHVCNFSKLFCGSDVADASDLKLPSFTDYNTCKYMFAQTPLSAAPELPATSAYYDQYKGFFQECTSLTVAPAIHITIDSNTAASIADMFYGCTSLSSVTVDFQNWENSDGLATTNWLYDVAASGTFTCASGLDTTVTRGPDTIPDGWTVVTV